MATPPERDTPAGLRRRAVLLRSAARLRSGMFKTDPVVCGLLVLLVAVMVALCLAVGPDVVPPGALILPTLAGAMLLSVRSLRVLVGVVALAVVYETVWPGDVNLPAGYIGVIAVACLFADWLARIRQRIGVQGLRGEEMLIDLRDRLRAQGEMPKLPPGWKTEVVLRSAGGASFGGDFLVAARTLEGTLVEVALVDVSGRGIDAGTRALLLSGALGGLLGAVPPDEFLPAANEYLLRQDWGDGFATAVHLSIELASGRFVVQSAGHLPVAQFAAGSGIWSLAEPAGMALGLFPDQKYLGTRGILEPGDALLLYTDGLVEVPGRDLDVGIDKLLGEAERLVTLGFRHGARTLIDAVAPAANDDRALLLIWRE